MIIRRFRDSDARKTSNCVRKALKEVSSEYYAPHVIFNLATYYSPEGMRERSRKNQVFVATEKEKILGTITLTHDGWILGLFVSPEHMCKGIGTKLVHKVESIAKKKGFDILRAHVAINALGFYKKLGYKVGRKKKWADYGDTYRVSKRI